MPYAYCRNCDAELGSPTFRESIESKIHCDSCGEDYQLNSDESHQAIIDLEERISVIEKHLGI